MQLQNWSNKSHNGLSSRSQKIMIPESIKSYSTETIKKIFLQNTENIMSEFYEMQTQFLAIRYRMNQNIETLKNIDIHLKQH